MPFTDVMVLPLKDARCGGLQASSATDYWMTSAVSACT